MTTNILLVDDEKEFVESLSQRLEIRGFDVKIALNGDEALKHVAEHPFDVVILDVQMPGKDGIETLKEIKSLRPLLQVLMLTGHGTVESAITGMKAGAYDYLIKPTETGELVKKLTAAYQVKRDHQTRIEKAEIDNIARRKGW